MDAKLNYIKPRNSVTLANMHVMVVKRFLTAKMGFGDAKNMKLTIVMIATTH